MYNQSSEDYLEAILLLSRELDYVHQIDIARKLKVSQRAVQKALKLLKFKGLIETDGLHIYLSQSGYEYASDILHKHNTIFEFLTLHGVNADDAENDACMMEHTVSTATFSMMEDYVNTHKK